ncbi:CNNM domain-containing protein [Roseivirga sp. BDSF3-8]|uniref:CNNM domain-containing protein n=1 Tax=Roseivirga sp. BDSF3-8 TaxID=3241598 RepID=UPI003531AC47
MTLLILFAVLSIVISFLCSVWEAVLLSIPPSYVQIQQSQGNTTGDLLRQFKDDIDRPLSAILSLNTIAHTAGAIGVGSVAEQALGSGDMVIFGITLPVSAEGLMGFVMTLAILILSEIIPKTIGATYWKNLAPFTVKSLNIITTLLFPLVWMSQFITKKLKKDTQGSIFSRADFTAMAELGAETGIFKPNESRILHNLLKFEKLTVHDIMTPRTVVLAARENLSINAFYEKFGDRPFSRYPVYFETRDNIDGFVLKDDVLKAIIKGDGDKQLKDIKRNILMVREDLKLHTFIDTLLAEREQVALVVDEFGGLEGLATVEDAVETLLGMEIVDESDTTEDMQQLARQNWERRAKRMGLSLEKMESNVKRAGQEQNKEDETSSSSPANEDDKPQKTPEGSSKASES